MPNFANCYCNNKPTSQVILTCIKLIQKTRNQYYISRCVFGHTFSQATSIFQDDVTHQVLISLMRPVVAYGCHWRSLPRFDWASGLIPGGPRGVRRTPSAVKCWCIFFISLDPKKHLQGGQPLRNSTGGQWEHI